MSGEHGIGLVKNGQLARQWQPAAVAMHEAIKRTFDPKGLLNPGKKLARTSVQPPATLAPRPAPARLSAAVSP